MEFLREDHMIVVRDDKGEIIAQIDYTDTDDPNVVEADHTFTSNVLRGQGVAGKLLTELVADMEAAGKKIMPVCSYVLKKFDEEPETYGHIDARKA